MMQRIQKSTPFLICVVVLTLLWALFFWRFLTPNPVDQLRFAEGDFTLHYYAFASYQVEQIQDGNTFPLWNPYNYAGDPFMGNVQWATWYPLRFVTAMMAGDDGLSVEDYQFEIILHYWLISVMMLLYLKQLVTRWESALFGSLIYTYGGYLSGYPMLQPSVLAAVAWTPLILLGAHLSVTKSGWRFAGLVLASVGIALSFFGGHPQTTMQMIYFVGAYLLFLGWYHKVNIFGIAWRGVLLVGLGVGLASVQLVPAIEFTANSARVQDLFYDAKSNGFSANEFFHAFYPFFISQWSPLYLGVAGLLMAIGALFNYQKRYAFWLIVIIAGLLLSMGGNNVVYDIFYLVMPGFNTFRQQERIASLVVFALVILATYHFDLTITRKAMTEARDWLIARVHLAIVAVIAFVATLASPFVDADLFNFPLREDVILFELGLEIVALIAVLSLLYSIWYWWQKKDTHATWLVAIPIIALLVVDLFTFNTRYTINFVPNEAEYITQPPDYAALLQQDVQEIQWRVDGSANLGGHGTYWQIPDMYGTGPFELSTTERLLHIGVDKRWELFAVRYITQPLGSTPPDYLEVEVIGDGMNYEGGEYTLYELMNPRPIAHLIYEVWMPEETYDDIEDEREAIRKIVNGAINLREIGVVARELPFELSHQRPDDALVSDFRMNTPEHVSMRVNTPENALLTIAIPNYPAWQAYVDGTPVPIIEVNGGLIGIPLEPMQDATIELRIESQAYETGRLLSIISVVLGIILLSVPLAMRRRNNTESQ